jgi:hypothetical protein
MDILTAFIAIVALVLAIMALLRSGGIPDLQHQMKELRFQRDQTANDHRDITSQALKRLENSIRKKQKFSSEDQTTSAS